MSSILMSLKNSTFTFLFDKAYLEVQIVFSYLIRLLAYLGVFS